MFFLPINLAATRANKACASSCQNECCSARWTVILRHQSIPCTCIDTVLCVCAMLFFSVQTKWQHMTTGYNRISLQLRDPASANSYFLTSICSWDNAEKESEKLRIAPSPKHTTKKAPCAAQCLELRTPFQLSPMNELEAEPQRSCRNHPWGNLSSPSR